MKYKKGTALHAELGRLIVEKLQKRVNVNGRLLSGVAICGATRISRTTYSFFKKGISNDAAQYLDVIGIYLDAAKDNPELFEDMAVDIARAMLDDYLMRQKPSYKHPESL